MEPTSFMQGMNAVERMYFAWEQQKNNPFLPHLMSIIGSLFYPLAIIILLSIYNLQETDSAQHLFSGFLLEPASGGGSGNGYQ